VIPRAPPIPRLSRRKTRARARAQPLHDSCIVADDIRAQDDTTENRLVARPSNRHVDPGGTNSLRHQREANPFRTALEDSCVSARSASSNPSAWISTATRLRLTPATFSSCGSTVALRRGP